MKRVCRRAAALLAALALGGGCKDERPAPAQSAAPGPAAEAAPAPIPSHLLPIEALTVLEVAPTELPPPCADTAAALAALDQEVTRHRRRLATDPDNRRAPAILADLAAAIAATTEDMPAPDGGEELARTHRELVAAWRDLQRALAELADVLATGDHAAARALAPRIENGIDNLGVTIERLSALCGAP